MHRDEEGWVGGGEGGRVPCQYWNYSSHNLAVVMATRICYSYFLPLRETNLKVRQPLPETAELSDHHDKLATFNGMPYLLKYCG